MARWHRGEQLAEGHRWASDLPVTFAYFNTPIDGEPPQLWCVVCHRKWKTRPGHDELTQANYDWLWEHAWTHAQLELVAREAFYEPPPWQTGKYDQAVSEAMMVRDVRRRR